MSELKGDFKLPKHKAEGLFSQFIKSLETEYHGSKLKKVYSDIGTHLQLSNYLFQQPKDCGYFQISSKKLFQFRNEKLIKLDEERIHGISKCLTLKPQTCENLENPLFKVDPTSPIFQLRYQSTEEQILKPNFRMTNLGCYICQKNLPSQAKYEEHVEDHFNVDAETTNSESKLFSLSYRLCQDSHFFSFTAYAHNMDLIIQKIIILQSNSIFYVKDNIVPVHKGSYIDYTFCVDCHMFTLGVEQPVLIVFHKNSDKNCRYVERHLFLRIEKFPRVQIRTTSIRLHPTKLFKPVIKVSRYIPSAKVKTALNLKFSPTALSQTSQKFEKYMLDKQLTEDNFAEVLTILLQIEDLDTMNQYLNLHQRNLKIRKFGNEYSVKLKKNKYLNTESIVKAMDEVILIPVSSAYKFTNHIDQLLPELARNFDNKSKIYVSTIEKVYNDSICFAHDGNIPDAERYDVLFRPSRLTLIYQYRALELLQYNKKTLSILFPHQLTNIPEAESINPKKTEKCPEQSQAVSNMKLFNESIRKCPEQLQAVENIVNGRAITVPYILFGPPGTGKTTTIVETVLQLWTRYPTSRILLTAGSNAACDEVALRLCKWLAQNEPHQRSLIRIFSKAYEKRLDTTNELLLEYSNLYSTHFYPHIEILHDYRIIVCTLTVVGKLLTGNFGCNGFFTHIFIDEAAASTEPEVLVGISGILSPQCKLIISGDHKQLRAVLQSQTSKLYGLDISIMERLLSRPCYAVNEKGEYDKRIQTRLRKNFRSHKKITNLFNNLYYNGELEAMAKEENVNRGCEWHFLPNVQFPIIFHSVFGTTGKKSSSMFNIKEIEAVMYYLKELMYFGINGKPINQSDIGIISPYQSQYKLIQTELNKRHWYEIETGSVEIFQGKEKEIIIVSLVRSFTNTLGFLDEPRRFNVTLSRAQSLLIIIGNPRTLEMNSDYKYVINVCQYHNSLLGSPFWRKEKETDNNHVNQSASKRRSRRRRFRRGKPTAALNQNSETNDEKRIPPTTGFSDVTNSMMRLCISSDGKQPENYNDMSSSPPTSSKAASNSISKTRNNLMSSPTSDKSDINENAVRQSISSQQSHNKSFRKVETTTCNQNLDSSSAKIVTEIENIEDDIIVPVPEIASVDQNTTLPLLPKMEETTDNALVLNSSFISEASLKTNLSIIDGLDIVRSSSSICVESTPKLKNENVSNDANTNVSILNKSSSPYSPSDATKTLLYINSLDKSTAVTYLETIPERRCALS